MQTKHIFITGILLLLMSSGASTVSGGPPPEAGIHEPDPEPVIHTSSGFTRLVESYYQVPGIYIFAAGGLIFLLTAGTAFQNLALRREKMIFLMESEMKKQVEDLNLELIDENTVLKQKIQTNEILESQYRSFFENTGDATIVVNGDAIVQSNPAALKLFHCSTGDRSIGVSPADLFPDVQPDGEASAEILGRNLAMAKKKGCHHFQCHCINKHGETFCAELMLTAAETNGNFIYQVTFRPIRDPRYKPAP